MSEQEQQDSQKTVVAFIAGLLIGGLLVWVFGGTPEEQKPTEEKQESEVMLEEEATPEETPSNNEDVAAEETPAAPTMQTGAGALNVPDQSAGKVVSIDSAEFPNDEGWIGIRDYQAGNLTGLLGVARFSKEQGLIPTEVELLRGTEAGKQYAAVFYTESGDRKFSLADDVQIEKVVETFTAQ